MPPWDDVRFFLALCRAGTLAGAARRLRVDETTVGRRITRLEAALDAKLAARTPGGLALTPAGEVVLASAEEMERAALALDRRARGADRRLAGRVRVTAPEILGNHLVLPALQAVHAAHPDIALELSTTMARLDVRRAEADVAVRVFRPEDPGLVQRRLGRYAMAAYVAAPRPGARASPPRAIVLLAEASRPPIRPLSERFPAGVALRATSLWTVAEAVRRGLGAGDLPCFWADADPALARAFPDEMPQLMELWAVLHPDVQRTARVRAVVRAIEREVARSAARLEGRLPRGDGRAPVGG